jgi:hypothetical protein
VSTLAVNAVTDANGGNTATINSMTPTADSLQGFRNRIINGDMRIAQRGTGAFTVSGSYAVDRFFTGNTSDASFSVQQDSSAPVGFVNSIKFTTTTADGTLTTTQRAFVNQNIEGFNVADLGWGTANAKTVTLSFWVRSSLTGTFGGSLVNATSNRSYPFTYSIAVANTWEQKSITIAGDTSGTWATDNGIGVRLFFGLGVGPDRSGTAGAWVGSDLQSATGAVSVIGTLNATWYITGVQLEVGSVATPFERRPYELALCQRYYYSHAKGLSINAGIATGAFYNATDVRATVFFPVSMRIGPSIVSSNGTNHYRWQSNNTSVYSNTVGTPGGGIANNCATIYAGTGEGLGSGTSGYAINVVTGSGDTVLAFNAEL